MDSRLLLRGISFILIRCGSPGRFGGRIPGDWCPREAGSACQFDGSAHGSNGSASRMERAREPVRGSAQRDSLLLSEGLAGDPAHAARRMVATGKCLRLCW